MCVVGFFCMFACVGAICFSLIGRVCVRVGAIVRFSGGDRTGQKRPCQANTLHVCLRSATQIEQF